MKAPFEENEVHSDPTHFPADPHLELSLLSTLLTDPDLMEALGFLDPSDFYESSHGEIFRRMRGRLAAGSGWGTDLIADRDDRLRHICLQAEMVWVSPLVAKDYARQVHDLAIKRRMLPLLSKVAEMSMNGVGPESIVEYMQDEIDKIRQGLITGNMFDRWKGQGITAAEAAEKGKIERVYVVEDLIREKSVSIFYGAPGEFKSALCMDLALCIANGEPWLKPLPVEGNKQRAFATVVSRVLWLNYDQGHDDIIERLGAMARVYGDGENVTAISQSYPMATLSTESQARALGEYCAREGYRVLIVDSLLDVKGKADLQEAGMGDVLRLWRIVAETGSVSVIIIAHNTKQTLDLYGSQFIKAKLDHLYYVSRPPGTDVAIIESKKQRNFGEQTKLYARWTWHHFDGTRTLETARFFGDSTESKAAHPNNTTQAAIKQVLFNSPGRGFDVSTLVSILNEGREDDEQISLAAIRKAANRLVENERNVGKTQDDDGGVVYHYGELTDN
jgi:hypothetical protein